MKFKKFLKSIVIVAFLFSGFIFSFIGGAYVSTQVKRIENPKEHLFKTINHAVNLTIKSTEKEPVVIILPKFSLLEKLQVWKDYNETRKVVYITSDVSTFILTGEPVEKKQTIPKRMWQTAVSSYNWVADSTWRKLS